MPASAVPLIEKLPGSLPLPSPAVAAVIATPHFRKRALSNASSTASASKRTVDDGSDTEDLTSTVRLNMNPTPASSHSADSPDLASLQVEGTSPSPAVDDSLPDYEETTDSVPVRTLPSANAPDPSAQVEIIKEMRRHDLTVGDSWFLVSRRWVRRWQTACSGIMISKEDDAGLSVDDIGPIDNTGITSAEGNLIKPVTDGVEVELLPQAAYEYLRSWYGTLGPEYKRKVTHSPDVFGSERVEFYPPRFSVLQLIPNNTSATISLPVHSDIPSFELFSGATVKELKELAAQKFNIHRPVRLWTLPDLVDSAAGQTGPSFIIAEKFGEDGSHLVESEGINEYSTISQALLDAEENRIAVEEQSADGKWITQAPPITGAAATSGGKKTSSVFGGGNFFDKMSHKPKTNILAPKYKSASSSSSSLASTSKAITDTVSTNGAKSNSFLSQIGALTRSRSGGRSGQRGLTGLTNLGNTCFMNSALQCMSNTKELQEYFLSGVYKDELNRDNPLGMRGQVAEAFGQLIERLWSTTSGAYPPREFKQALSKFAPQFSGYGQQDSQELLAFLLDGTHEDLNRIKKKPATSAPDWEGGDDRALVQLAKTCWEQYRSRNDSVIVDLFQGQYRSTVVCPDCCKVSITFDPFMYVTTNLPVMKKWSGTVYFVPIDPSKPRYAIELELPKSATLKMAKVAIAKFMDVDPKHLVSAEEWHSKFFKPWYDDDMVSEINTNNDRIIFFETATSHPQPKPRTYGKNKNNTTPLPPSDTPIILSVIHNRDSKHKAKSSKKMYGAHTDVECFGSPFLVCLSPLEASTEHGIYKAIAVQYSRVSKKSKELLEFVESADDSLHSDELVNFNSSNATPLPATPPEDVFMDVDGITAAEPATDETVVGDSENVPLASRFHKLFDLQVSKATKKSGSIPLDQNDFTGPTVPLKTRITRCPTPESDGFSSVSQSTMPGSFIATRSAVAAAAAGNQAAKVDENLLSDGHTITIAPLVQTGDYVIAEWGNAALEYFFGGDGTTGPHALWSEVTSFVDPAVAASKDRSRRTKKVITIEDCLTEFTKEEKLGEDDTWYCPVCKKHQQASKKVEIWKVPDVLVFAFKRFSSNRYSRDKIDDLVDFPIEGFNMEEYVEGDKVERRLAAESGSTEEPEPLIYDLYAVDNHYGGLGGGHYTAFAKNHENGKWYEFDDSRVSEVQDPERVKTQAAYLLFYRRRTTRPIGGAKSRELVNSALQSLASSANNSEVAIFDPGASAPCSSQNSRDPSPDARSSFFDRSHVASGPLRFGDMFDLTHSRSSPSMSSSPSSEVEAESGSPNVNVSGRGSPISDWDITQPSPELPTPEDEEESDEAVEVNLDDVSTMHE